MRQTPPLLKVLLVLMLLCAASVIAAVPDPAIYLTANLTAVATTAAVTEMEQALLDLIAGGWEWDDGEYVQVCGGAGV